MDGHSADGNVSPWLQETIQLLFAFFISSINSVDNARQVRQVVLPSRVIGPTPVVVRRTEEQDITALFYINGDWISLQL